MVRAPTLQPELGQPNALFASKSEGVLCGIHDDGPRCFEIDSQGQLSKAIRLVGVKELKGLTVSSSSGHAFVLDGAKVLYGHFEGTLRVGNPFAVSNPLAVDVTMRPFLGATVTLEPFPRLGAIRAMAKWFIWPVVLDDQGIAQIDDRAGIERWPTKGAMSNLWSGFLDASFYTREGDTLHERRREKGKFVDRVVKGISKPVQVAADMRSTCVLEEGGGVACLRTPLN